MKLTKEEILRKLLHIFALLIPLGIYYLPEIFQLPEYTAPLIVGGLVFISFLTELLRFRFKFIQKIFMNFFGKMMRKNERFEITGSTYILGGGFLCTCFFMDRPDISFISLFVFILGDAAAALVGIEFGKHKIRNKSIEGCLGCFFTSLFLLIFVIPLFPGVMDNFGGGLSPVKACFISLVVTVLELYGIKIFNHEFNDNLYVPVLLGCSILIV